MKSVVRICFVFEFALPPYRRFLFDKLREKKVDYQVFTGGDKFDKRDEASDYRLPLLVESGENKLYWLSPFRLVHADVIITTLNLRRPHTWVWIFLYPRKKWILWGQGKWKNQSVLLRMLRAAIFRRSNAFIVYTEGGRESLVRQGYPAENISVAYNTLMVSNAEATQGTDYFLYVGRLQERKEVELAIESIKGTRHQLRIVGDGKHKKQLVSVAENSGVLEQVHFYPGTFNDEILKKHFGGAIAYISPGHVGLGVVHAFAYGVPVITLDSREHAPEFEYCLANNSYLCFDEDQLRRVVAHFDCHSFVHLAKRKAAFEFYRQKLSPENMLSCFLKYL